MNYVTDRQRPHLGGNLDGGDPRTFCPELWRWLVDRYKVRTVYDVGCGEGQAMDAFAALGCHVVGLDGLPQCKAVRGSFLCHDLATGPMPLEGVDLVWCSEVVEHIDEAHLGNLLDTICCGRLLAMSHATQGQSGHHHVNCQPASYWVAHIESRGLRLLGTDTLESRSFPGPFWQQTGLIFQRAA
jgi:SAM-dependent methyltransferase